MVIHNNVAIVVMDVPHKLSWSIISLSHKDYWWTIRFYFGGNSNTINNTICIYLMGKKYYKYSLFLWKILLLYYSRTKSSPEFLQNIKTIFQSPNWHICVISFQKIKITLLKNYKTWAYIIFFHIATFCVCFFLKEN